MANAEMVEFISGFLNNKRSPKKETDKEKTSTPTGKKTTKDRVREFNGRGKSGTKIAAKVRAILASNSPDEEDADDDENTDGKKPDDEQDDEAARAKRIAAIDESIALVDKRIEKLAERIKNASLTPAEKVAAIINKSIAEHENRIVGKAMGSILTVVERATAAQGDTSTLEYDEARAALNPNPTSISELIRKGRRINESQKAYQDRLATMD